MRLFNIYNDCKNSDTITSLHRHLRREERREERGGAGENRQDIWLGDFNRHHPMWDKAGNNQLFTRKNLDEAEQLINLAATYGMEMVLPPGEPTRRDWATRNTTRPDNVFCSEGLAEAIVKCETHPKETPPTTDHFPIDTTFQIDLSIVTEEERQNFREVDWKAFRRTLARKMEGRQWDEEIRTPEELEERVQKLEKAITDTIVDNVPVFRIHAMSKRWWTKELAQERKDYNGIARRSHALRDQDHPIHESARRSRNQYKAAIQRTKRQYWENWLEEVKGGEVWRANIFVNRPAGDGGRARVPALQKEGRDGRTEEVNDNEGKSLLFHKTFFKARPHHNNTQNEDDFPPKHFSYTPIANQQIEASIHKLNLFKAPGLSEIPNVVLIKNCEQLVIAMGPIFRATFELHTYPTRWKSFNTVVLRKPGKKDYTQPNAYRPIALLDTIAKVLSSCVKETLTYHMEKLGLLPNMQFGGRPGRTATDAVLALTNFIKNKWKGGKVVAALFLDVKAAFPSTDITQMVQDMRKRGIPKTYTDWLMEKAEGRKTVISFDDFKSQPIKVESGLDQGCNLSGLCYAFYSADQIASSEGKRNELAGSFVDDTVYATSGDTKEEVVEKLSDMMTREGGGLEWARKHGCTYEFTKFGYVPYVLFTRKRENDPERPGKIRTLLPPNLRVNNQTIEPIKMYKYLGTILDRELRFKEHTNYATGKGALWIARFRRLAKTSKGLGTKLL